jgi:hypothetical protein
MEGSGADTAMTGATPLEQQMGAPPQQQQQHPAAPRISSDSSANTMMGDSPASSPACEEVPPRAAPAAPYVEDPAHPPLGLSQAEREWMYHLVTFPSYFTPCGNCCSGTRTPKREQLITHFDTFSPYQVSRRRDSVGARAPRG